MKSPLVTAVVGTSTASPRPNAPLTATIASTIARTTSAPTILRLLLRHMPLHHRAGFETGRHDHLVVVHGSHRDRSLARTAAVHHSHGETVFFAEQGVPRHHDRVVLSLQFDVNAGGEIRHQLRVIPLD